MTLGGTSLTSQQFGIGYTSTSGEGILGIGYRINEVARTTYSNLPASLVTQGGIASNAYSLWLNDLDASTGSILFGGVDTDKFEGTLATLPIQTEAGAYAEFLVTLTGVSMGSTTIASSEAIAVLLDSGTSLTYLPDSWTSDIFDQVGARYDSSEGAAFIPCSQASNTTTLDFTFSSPTIKIAMAELILDITTSDGQPYLFSNKEQACLFGIAPAGISTPVLGDTFLRSAYVVYDLSNNEISLAQTTFNSTTSNVLEIASGTSGVPSATAVADSTAATADALSSSSIADTTVGLTTGSSGASSVGTSILAEVVAILVAVAMV